MVQFCPKCGTPAPDDQSLFCNRCGNQLPKIIPEEKNYTCPNCGTKIIDKQSVFCIRCGSSVSPSQPPKSQPSQKMHNNKMIENDPPKQVKVFGNQKITKEQFEAYKPNWILFLVFAFGLISIFFAPLLVIIVIASAIAVYYDAKAIRAGEQVTTELTMNTNSWTPLSWGLLVLLLWIIALPLYLYKRKEIFFQNYQEQSSSFSNELISDARIQSYPQRTPNIGNQKSINNINIHSEEKSPFIAALCSFFIPGLGQVYNGETAKGVGFFIGLLVFCFFFSYVGLIMWILGIFEAYYTANRMTKGEVVFKPTKTAHLILFIFLVVFIVAVVALFAFAAAFTQYYTSNSATYSSSPLSYVTSGGTSSAISSISTTTQAQQSTFSFSDVKMTSEGEYIKMTYISGKIKNTGSTSPKQVIISAFFYDKDGIRIEDGNTYVSDLKSGETAVFKILIPSQSAASVTKWDLKAQGY